MTQLLYTSCEIKNFFENLINNAEKKIKISLDVNIKSYLVTLLIDYINNTPYLNSSIGIKLMEASQYNKTKRCFELKQIGDYTLYNAGYFFEQFINSIIDRKYFIEIGETAYGMLSSEGIKAFSSDMFYKMSKEFRSCADVLTQISEDINDSNDSDIDLYEKWLETKNKEIYIRLVKKGLIPSQFNS